MKRLKNFENMTAEHLKQIAEAATHTSFCGDITFSLNNVEATIKRRYDNNLFMGDNSKGVESFTVTYEGIIVRLDGEVFPDGEEVFSYYNFDAFSAVAKAKELGYDLEEVDE